MLCCCEWGERRRSTEYQRGGLCKVFYSFMFLLNISLLSTWSPAQLLRRAAHKSLHKSSGGFIPGSWQQFWSVYYKPGGRRVWCTIRRRCNWAVQPRNASYSCRVSGPGSSRRVGTFRPLQDWFLFTTVRFSEGCSWSLSHLKSNVHSEGSESEEFWWRLKSSASPSWEFCFNEVTFVFFSSTPPSYSLLSLVWVHWQLNQASPPTRPPQCAYLMVWRILVFY